jgi:hypothetical protein
VSHCGAFDYSLRQACSSYPQIESHLYVQSILEPSQVFGLTEWTLRRSYNDAPVAPATPTSSLLALRPAYAAKPSIRAKKHLCSLVVKVGAFVDVVELGEEKSRLA